MEDHKNDLILILAGYQKEMESFLQTNPGLRSRFPIHIDFPDYNQNELIQIAEQMCAKRQYTMSDEALNSLMLVITKQKGLRDEAFGNARTIRNIIEKAIRQQAVRLIAKSNTTRQDLISLEPGDLTEVRL
ncbi:AAA family ATPase [Dendrosporobacter sp. 1207_IL3150]|uniref:AAA family ATPase n=1 Tax=Dendrosporobacter sp. 1207_IL3150 TaxID=3084054 RepID=UPI002FDA691B